MLVLEQVRAFASHGENSWEQHLSRLQHQLWQGDQVSSWARTSCRGAIACSIALPGAGWTPGSITELLIEESGVGEIRLLARSIRELTAGKSRSVIFVALPWMPNLAAFRAMKIPTKQADLGQGA